MGEEILPHEPHFHHEGNKLIFVSTPRAVCPFCEMEWNEQKLRKQIRRLKALLRKESEHRKGEKPTSEQPDI